MTGTVDGYVEDSSVLDQFNDGDQVYEIYKEAMCWAVSAGIFGGDDQNNLNPHNFATRAELLVMMIRYIDYANS